jgi:hypothetical protein
MGGRPPGTQEVPTLDHVNQDLPGQYAAIGGCQSRV